MSEEFKKQFKSMTSKYPLNEYDKEELEREDEKQKLAKEIKYNFEVANIPLRYRDAEFKAINREQEEIIKKFGEFKPKSLILFGSVGTGKTHLAIGFMKELIKRGYFSKYIHILDYLNYYRHRKVKNWSLESFKEAKFLILDDIGYATMENWEIKVIQELIYYRYDNLLHTFLITNLELGELKELLGDRAVDRLRDSDIETIKFHFKSLRTK